MVVVRFMVPNPQRPFKLGHLFCNTEDFGAEITSQLTHGFQCWELLTSTVSDNEVHTSFLKKQHSLFSPRNRKLSMLLLDWESYCSLFLGLINIAGYDKITEWIKCPTDFTTHISVLTQITEFIEKDGKAASDTNNSRWRQMSSISSKHSWQHHSCYIWSGVTLLHFTR